MKHKKGLWIPIVMLAFLVSACYPYVNNPVLKDWPQYAPANSPYLNLVEVAAPIPGSCLNHTVDTLGAWVTAGNPENDPFPFTDVDGKACQGSFYADILPLFQQANLWYPGSLSCRTCHGPDVENSYARMDLSSYAGILAGKGRASADTNGDDILGGGNWEESALFKILNNGEMPPGQPAGADPKGPVISAGSEK